MSAARDGWKWDASPSSTGSLVGCAQQVGRGARSGGTRPGRVQRGPRSSVPGSTQRKKAWCHGGMAPRQAPPRQAPCAPAPLSALDMYRRADGGAYDGVHTKMRGAMRFARARSWCVEESGVAAFHVSSPIMRCGLVVQFLVFLGLGALPLRRAWRCKSGLRHE